MRQITMILILLCAACLCSCRSTGETTHKAERVIKVDTAMPLGWIDADTFRTMATGSGREKAVSNAQLAVIEKFITERIKLSGPAVDPRSTGVSIVNEFGDDVKRGSVIAEKAEAEGVIRIIYQVKSANLKNRVQGRKR